MPIEDVDYLKQSSIRQSYIFLVDSADRDRATWPTPSEYVVQFTEPFKNVVGMEVLDASVPRTMYSIDAPNNSLTFLIHSAGLSPAAAWGSGGAAGAAATVSIEPGEYTVQTLIPALNAALRMPVYAGAGSNAGPTAGITVSALSEPADVKNILQFRCPYPFFIDAERSTMAETLGFDGYTASASRGATIPTTTDGIAYYTDPIPATTRVYHSLDLPFSTGSNYEPDREVFAGPRGILRRLPLSTTDFVAQRFSVDADGWLTQVFAALTTEAFAMAGGSGGSGGGPAPSGATWEVRSGTATAPTWSSAPIAAGTIALSAIDGTLSDSNRVAAFITVGSNYWLILRAIDAPLQVFYNDVLTTETTLRYGTGTPAAPLPTPDTNGLYFHLSASIILKNDYHRIIAPGIYSLIGPRYLTLRVPEIEEHSFRSLSYSRHTLGLAKIRLGVVGYSENRLDYSNVPNRQFHPIGKLSRMTLRFVLPSGELYDFKGVNHTITFAIHYLEPVQQERFQRSILNANYDGDFIRYKYTQEAQEGDAESADDAAEEADYNRDAFDYTALRNEAYHLPENRRLRDREALFSLGDEIDDADDEPYY